MILILNNSVHELNVTLYMNAVDGMSETGVVEHYESYTHVF